MLSNADVKAKGKELGVDLIGIAPIDRFQSLADDENPRSINPYTQSVVALGFQINRGALRGIEEGTAWQTMTAGSPVHPMIMAELTYLFCRWFEIAGWEATPVFHHPVEMKNQGVRVDSNKPAPDVILNMDYLAHAAGLGNVGAGKFFLTPELGPRQVFCAILTDAVMDRYDAILESNVCDQCGECLQACPLHAYADDRFTASQLCGAEATWHTLTTEICRACPTGIVPNPYIDRAEPCRIGAACGRACVAHLENAGRLTRTFVTNFRHP